MRCEPAALELLLAARSWLLEELTPQLAREKRYDALLVASAMAIVARELQMDCAEEETEWRQRTARLCKLYPGIADEGERVVDFLHALSAQLARDIRAGKFDDPGVEREALRQFLRDATIDNLKKYNPKYLELEDSA